MYPGATLSCGFSYPIFHQQLLSNAIERNRILPNSNELFQAKYGNGHIPSLSNDHINIKNVPNCTTKTERPSRKRPANSYTTRFAHPDRLHPRQSSLETIPAKRLTPLIVSQSNDILADRIQRERRSHTMAPMARISRPSSTPQAKMFATIAALADKPTKKSHHLIDEDAPIIVKVRYDPQAGGRPTEDAVRKAINQQIFDQNPRKEPIVLNFFEQRNVHSQIRQRPFPSVPHPCRRNRNTHVVQTQSTRTSRVHRTGFNQFKSIDQKMAAQQSSTYYNHEQLLSNQSYSGPSSGEVFRPPAVTDIPELRRENLLNMLNQIPDLQGRQFNIEYAPPTAPNGFPIPSHTEMINNAYPDPVVIDRLPSNIIQHVQSSNNPALKAAFEATIQREQYIQPQSTISPLNVQPAAVVHHAAPPYNQVQQSRAASSDDSESSTEASSSSEETDSDESEDVPTAQSGNHPSFVGPIPPTSH